MVAYGKAVVGEPDDDLGQRIVAYVVGNDIRSDGLIIHIAGGPRFQYGRAGERRSLSSPSTPSRCAYERPARAGRHSR